LFFVAELPSRIIEKVHTLDKEASSMMRQCYLTSVLTDNDEVSTAEMSPEMIHVFARRMERQKMRKWWVDGGKLEKI